MRSLGRRGSHAYREVPFRSLPCTGLEHGLTMILKPGHDRSTKVRSEAQPVPLHFLDLNLMLSSLRR